LVGVRHRLKEDLLLVKTAQNYPIEALDAAAINKMMDRS
jgi:hypothetical protein